MDKSDKISKSLIVTGVVLVIANASVNLIKGAAGIALMGPISTIIITLFSFTHGVIRYGTKKMLFFVAMISIVSWGYETLSILTGFPFGHYHYSDVLGPKIWLVPVVIMPAYFAVGYLSWVIGLLLLGKKDGNINGNEVFVIPVIAAFIMVFWDVSMDPINSTVTKMWIWHDGGGYFGVPFVNYMGWYLCVFTFYLIFAMNLRNNETPILNHSWSNRAFWILPVLMYASHIPEYAGGALFKESVKVVSEEGHVWWTGDIYTTATLISIFTMFFISIISLVSFSRENKA